MEQILAGTGIFVLALLPHLVSSDAGCRQMICDRSCPWMASRVILRASQKLNDCAPTKLLKLLKMPRVV